MIVVVSSYVSKEGRRRKDIELFSAGSSFPWGNKERTDRDNKEATLVKLVYYIRDYKKPKNVHFLHTYVHPSTLVYTIMCVM